MDHLPTVAVRVETTELDSAGRRQIAPRTRATALLTERRDQIQQAITDAIDVVRAPLTADHDTNGWHVSEVTATFGITLTAEAGVIITRAAAEASFEVVLTLQRTAGRAKRTDNDGPSSEFH